MKKIIWHVCLVASSISLATTGIANAEKPNGRNSLTNRMNRINSCTSMSTSSHIGSSNCFTGSFLGSQEQRNDERVTGLQTVEFLPAPSSGNPTILERETLQKPTRSR